MPPAIPHNAPPVEPPKLIMVTHTTTTQEELLILTKTYPLPSDGYRETTCVAAVTNDGEMRRLYPVPYRLLADDKQFKKWQWITAHVSRSSKDQRPESRRVDADSIQMGEAVEVKRKDWSQRLRWIEPHIMETFTALEARRQTTGETLGFVRPKRLLELQITRCKQPDWTEADKIKLSQEGLFDTVEVKARKPLRKLPYDFHYRYECVTAAGSEPFIHKLTDWEVGALFWKCMQGYGPNGWEEKFRHRLEAEFSQKDLLLLMGTIHRFPDQWLIVGLVYPPKPPPGAGKQLGLPLGQ